MADAPEITDKKMSQVATPNIDKLERVVLALGHDVSVSVQPSSMHGVQHLWTVSGAPAGQYIYGQGDNLAVAIEEFERSRIAKAAPCPLSTIEAAAA